MLLSTEKVHCIQLGFDLHLSETLMAVVWQDNRCSESEVRKILGAAPWVPVEAEAVQVDDPEQIKPAVSVGHI